MGKPVNKDECVNLRKSCVLKLLGKDFSCQNIFVLWGQTMSIKHDKLVMCAYGHIQCTHAEN